MVATSVLCFDEIVLQTEAPLLIRPLIGSMSTSEIHAVMVGGFATIAGSVMATYILIGVRLELYFSEDDVNITKVLW